jgi:hypothetical protein
MSRHIALFWILPLAVAACAGGSNPAGHGADAGATHPVAEVKSPLASAFAATDWSVFGRKFIGCAPPSGQTWDQFTPDVYYTDITGDGIPDALMVGACPTSTSPAPEMVAIFSGSSVGRNPHKIGLLPTDAGDYFTTLHLSVRGPVITISGAAYGPGKVGGCCPDEELTITYRWQAGRFVKISQGVGELSS